MDELLQLVMLFMQQLPSVFDELDDEEAGQIATFLQEVFGFIQERQQQPSPPPTKVGPTTPQGIELLWILSGEEPNAFVNYLRTYPGPGFRELAGNPDQLAQVIQNLQSRFPGGEVTQDAQGFEGTLFPSSNVAGMKYDPQNQSLLVKFHGDNGEPVYQYDGVPPQIFYLLEHGNAFAKTRGKNKWGEWWPMKNPSIGAALNQFLKAGGFPYQRIS